MYFEASYIYDLHWHKLLEKQVVRDRTSLRWRRRVIDIGLPIATVLLGITAARFWYAGDRGDAIFWTVLCGVYAGLYALAKWLRLRRFRRAIKRRRPGVLETAPQRIVLTDGGVLSDLNAFGKSEMAWTAFCRASSNDDLLLLYLSNIDYFMVPRGELPLPDWNALCAEVVAKIGNQPC